MSACAGMGEMAGAALETKTLERQANRASVGLAIIRQNDIMMNKIGISSDALWPYEIGKDVSESDKNYIDSILYKDPFFATKIYTNAYQRQQLGGYIDSGVSSLTYRAFKNMMVIFGEDPSNWPNALISKKGFSNFLAFDKGEIKPIEAINGTLYKTVGEAIISLMPENFQKDLEPLREAMQEAIDDVEELQAKQGNLKADIQADENIKSGKDLTSERDSLSQLEISTMNQDIATLDIRIEKKEKVAEEKREIYFTKLDLAVEALKNDIRLTPENIKLAKAIYQAMDNIENGSLQAGVMFSTALTFTVGTAFANFSKELSTLALSSFRIPFNLKKLYAKRVARVLHNSLFLIPNISMGSYYAVVQSSLAGKYKKIAAIIVEANTLLVNATIAK